MNRCFFAIFALCALVLSTVGTAAFDASKIAAVSKAADSFLALAKDSARTGQPPRQSDPAVKALLDTVFDTTEIQSNPARPIATLQDLSTWTLAVAKVGLVYILAGTGVDDITRLSGHPEAEKKADHNTIEFAPEIGRYSDAQLWLETAVINAVDAFVAGTSPVQREQPNFKTGLDQIRAGAVQTIYGALTTLKLEGLSDAWRRDRLPALTAIAPRAARLLQPEQARLLSKAATEVSARTTDPAVKAALTSFAVAVTSH